MQRAFLSSVLLIGLLLAACGGGNETTESSSRSVEQAQTSGETTPTKEAREGKPYSGGLVGPEPKPDIPNGPPPKSFVSKDLVKGDGTVAEAGDSVLIQYVGADYKTGSNYDSSWEWGNPYRFTLGSEEVIDGLEQGVEGMAVGDRRELVIPPAFADPTGEVSGIPDHETVVYVVDLLAVE
ncbi:MAG TPA: FKBP-type peptidyl-prolyl cis-trans isomerase [Solirubrobacterales bacterium]|nr:FKBP-type peptidyl-prolyl cis-trans isomerase [Solirubrobacterales bacterium]